MKNIIVILASLLGILNAYDLSDSLQFFSLEANEYSSIDDYRFGMRDSLNMRCVGRWPFGTGLEVSGDSVRHIVCYGGGSGVIVFDITDPASPVRRSQICADGWIDQLLVKDTLLFIARLMADDGLAIYNIADPDNPVKIGVGPIPVRDLCLKDSFAFCVNEDSLRVLNIADPGNPFQVSAIVDNGYVVGISGNYLFTGGGSELRAIDISDPHNPHAVNSIPADIWAMVVDGTQLYANNHGSGFTIYNISNPLSIWQESVISGLGGLDYYKLGDYVYLPEFWIIDVSDSANPMVVGDTVLPVTAWAVWVNHNFDYAYIANAYEGFRPINITNPTQPLPGESYYGADDSRDVFVQGNYAYVSNARCGLKILDVSQPSNPYEVGEYDTVGQYYDIQTVFVRDSLAYLTVWTLDPYYSKYFRILNISNPATPTIIGQHRVSISGSSNDIIVRDTIAYVLYDSPALQSIIISNPVLPETLPHYTLPDYTTPFELFLKDTIAYIADGDSGLRIIDVSNPAAPYEVGYFNDPSIDYATGIFVKDTIAYLASGATGLRILNIINPNSPFEISSHPNAAIDVSVDDTIAYVTSYAGYVNVLNVADPINPLLIGYYDHGYYVYRLFLDSSLVYVSCHESGMLILEWYGTGVEEFDKNDIAAPDLGFELSPTVTIKVVQVFVHPSTNRDCDVVIYDKLGRAVMDVCRNQEMSGGVEKQVDLSHLPAGVYFVRLKTTDYAETKKVILLD